MKKISIYLLLAASFLLAGCQKTGFWGSDQSNVVRFTASSTPVGTKTAYDAYDSETNPSWQRIAWNEGDEIRIWSTEALDRYSDSKHFATYKVSSVSNSGRNSTASIVTNAAIGDPNVDHSTQSDDLNGLVWGEKGGYHFYAIYPPTTSANGASGVLNASIPGSQTVTVAENVASPDMSKAFMTAAAYVETKENGKGSAVTLSFDPAFTAFEFTLKSVNEHKITGVQLKSLSTALAGDYTVTYTEDEGHSLEKTYGCPDFSATNSVVSTSFDGCTINSTTSMTVTLFALPQQLTDLVLSITYQDNSQSAPVTRTLGLSQNGKYIKFDACKKHRIYGLEMPDGTWKLYLETEVAQWKLDSHAPVYGNADADGVVINAAALEFASGVGSRQGRTLVTLKNPAEPLVAYFGLFAPTGENCKWRITMKGEKAGHFTLTSVTADSDHQEASADGAYVEGPVFQRVYFTLTPNAEGENAAQGGDSVELYFTVVVSTTEGEGEAAVTTTKEYSLHSEVTRDTKPLTVKMP